MKKRILTKVLSILLFAVPGLLSAQHCDSIEIHLAGWYNMYTHELIQTGQSEFLTRSVLFDLDENGLLPNYVSDPAGTIVYKIISNATSGGLIVSDSVHTPGVDKSHHLWKKLFPDNNIPKPYHNVDASIVCDAVTGESFLDIAFFDDLLNYSEDLHVRVPLADTIVFARLDGGWLLDKNNDIIIQYCIPSRHETHFTRFGLDGTLKYEKIFPESEIPVDEDLDSPRWNPQGLRRISDTPLRYCFYGRKFSGCTFIGLVLDSVFNVLNRYELLDQLNYYPATMVNGANNSMVVLDDGVLIVRNTQLSNYEFMTGIVKYDNDCHPLGEVWFPLFGNTQVFCVDLQKDNQGALYLSLYNWTNPYYSGPQLVVIKLDADFNIIWERFAMDSLQMYANRMILLEQGGVALLGVRFPDMQTQQTGMFLVVLEDQYSETTEVSPMFKPYCFFPNPVDDRLHMEFSPDVTPQAVEIYDVKGRLVGTQNTGLENVDMSQLPSGIYTLNVVVNDGIVYSEKVVKK